MEVKGEDDVVALTQYSSNPISRVQNSLTKFPVLIVISQRSLSSPDCNFTDDFFDTLGIKAPVTGQCFNVVKITVCVTGVVRIRLTPNISSVFIGHCSVCKHVSLDTPCPPPSPSSTSPVTRAARGVSCTVAIQEREREREQFYDYGRCDERRRPQGSLNRKSPWQQKESTCG